MPGGIPLHFFPDCPEGKATPFIGSSSCRYFCSDVDSVTFVSWSSLRRYIISFCLCSGDSLALIRLQFRPILFCFWNGICRLRDIGILSGKRFVCVRSPVHRLHHCRIVAALDGDLPVGAAGRLDYLEWLSLHIRHCSALFPMRWSVLCCIVSHSSDRTHDCKVATNMLKVDEHPRQLGFKLLEIILPAQGPLISCKTPMPHPSS